MKVYVVIQSRQYEGCFEPEGIFSTREKAEAVQQRVLSRTYPIGTVEVYEYDLDEEVEQ